jgi:hypothetical protein
MFPRRFQLALGSGEAINELVVGGAWPPKAERNARDAANARQGAYEQSRTNIFPSEVLVELWSPEQFDAAAAFVRPEDLDEYIRIAADPQEDIDCLQPLLELGISGLALHNVNRAQEAFIEVFDTRVLPSLRHTERGVI